MSERDIASEMLEYAADGVPTCKTLQEWADEVDRLQASVTGLKSRVAELETHITKSLSCTTREASDYTNQLEGNTMNNIYGPNTKQVTAFIERLKVLTVEEIAFVMAWDEAWDEARDEAWNKAWDEARDEARDTARHVACAAAGAAACEAARVASWGQCWDAILALVVRDLISVEHFDVLTEPFKEIINQLEGVKP